MSHASITTRIGQTADAWKVVRSDVNPNWMFVHVDDFTLLLDAEDAVTLAQKLQSVAAEILINNDGTGPEGDAA